ncbi:MAG: UDP-N-acetylmuramoyl-tripeptide--D-alanyl-D-alanine ligase [Rhizomicrobium sp.]
MTLWTSAEVEAATLGRISRKFAVTGLSIDSRTLEPGDLFVALKGARDGHDFVHDAFKAKAAAAMVSHPIAGAPGPLVAVADTQRGLEDLARAGRARSNARIAAVTGSAGKTTTKEMLRLCLNALGRTHASFASHNNHWGVPLSLALLPSNAEYGAFEIGMNRGGEIRNLVGFVRPHVALITTIAPAHLEFFGSCEAIADAKSEIFEGLVPGGSVLIPADSPYAGRLAARAAQLGVTRVLRFGADGDAKLIAAEPGSNGMRLKADILGRAVDCQLGGVGTHIALNAVAALAAVALLDGDVLNAAAALKDFSPLKGRGARFQTRGAEVIDESYNANPASMAAALALLGLASGRKLAVLGDMLELGKQALPHHAALAAPIALARTDLVFLCGPHMNALWDALPKERRGSYTENSASLAPHVLDALRPGDTVLVKGSLGSRMAAVIEALRKP